MEGGVFKRFRYDAAGRLAEVRDDGDTTVQEQYTYGASSQRLLVTQGSAETVYAWDGGQVAEYSSATSSSALTWQKGYVYLGGRLLATVTPGGGKQYHHPDRLGTRVMTNADGSFAGRQESLPYGAMIDSSATTTRRFTSYDRSVTTKLDYAVNRFYNAAQGRFTQVDPIGMGAASLGDPQSLNLYAYCGNDPVNHVDPEGLFFKKLFKWIGKIFKWIALAATIAIAVLTLIPAGWAGTVLAKIAIWSSKHPILSSLLGLKGPTYAILNLASKAGAAAAGFWGLAGAGAINSLLGSTGAAGKQNVTGKQKKQMPGKDCRSLLRQIYDRAVELYRRRVDFIKDVFNLRIRGNKDSRSGTLEGHEDQFRGKQTNLKDMLDEYNKGKCGGRGGANNEGDILSYARLMLDLPLEKPDPRWDPGYQKPAYPARPPEDIYFYPMDPVMPGRNPMPGRIPVRIPFRVPIIVP